MKSVERFQNVTGLSRRYFLRGAGVALALPWMEALPLSGAQTQSVEAPASNKPPVRFACLYFSNGVEPIHWWAKESGASMEIGQGLEPMAPFREDMIFVRGLFNETSLAYKGAHLGKMPNLLSGALVSTDPNDIRVGTSMDQVLAQRIGKDTAVPSLVLGIEPTELRLEDGLSMIYGSCISWATATRPATKEIYPARAFELLVSDGKSRRLDRSILDQVLEDTHQLKLHVGRNDREKLDEYLESIRDIEKRIDRAAKDGRREGWNPSSTQPDMPRPADDLPHHVPEHMKLMMDIIVLAFRMDKTRIATCMLNNDLSQMNFGFLDGVRGSLHIDLTHNGKAPEIEAMYLKTNQFHVQQFAYLVKRLKEIQEGERSLLDNSLLMLCSNLFDGDSHQCDEIPILLAGRAGGAVKTGRVVNYRDKGSENRRACSLYLSVMDRMGVQLDRFGDADRQLTDL